jgi:hypothetical protein
LSIFGRFSFAARKADSSACRLTNFSRSLNNAADDEDAINQFQKKSKNPMDFMNLFLLMLNQFNEITQKK